MDAIWEYARLPLFAYYAEIKDVGEMQRILIWTRFGNMPVSDALCAARIGLDALDALDALEGGTKKPLRRQGREEEGEEY